VFAAYGHYGGSFYSEWSECFLLCLHHFVNAILYMIATQNSKAQYGTAQSRNYHQVGNDWMWLRKGMWVDRWGYDALCLMLSHVYH
jgi:hypothetical protein